MRVFLTGGNWIASDQLNRYVANPQRYFDEVKMHAESGLNFIRLWGGAGGNGDGLFDAADELGVMVMHEFWMSGDNNGRWAGSYDWPLDHRLYLAAAGDTISRLRGHASLILWCGGNELYPATISPPRDIAVGLAAMVGASDVLERLGVSPAAAAAGARSGELSLLIRDPSRRPFVLSSATNYTSTGDNHTFDPILALAPSDGPYGLLREADFYTTRNPGMKFYNGSQLTVDLAFQPEVGSSCTPVLDSMARFLSPAALADFPPLNSSYANASAVWQYHAYLPFTDSPFKFDHAYAYGGTINTTEEYVLRTQLAQVRQYQALIEGYSLHAWSYYSAVVIWKSQSPWPSLRGCLYDSYLAPNGGYFGVKAASGGGYKQRLAIIMNQGTGELFLFNRGLLDVPGPLTLTVRAWELSDSSADPVLSLSAGVTSLPANATPGRSSLTVAWPSTVPRGSTVLFRLSLAAGSGTNGSVLARNEYWLSNLDLPAADVQDFASLGRLRDSGVIAQISASAVGSLHNSSSFYRGPATTLRVNLVLSRTLNSGPVAFGLTVVLRRAATTAAAGAGRDGEALGSVSFDQRNGAAAPVYRATLAASEDTRLLPQWPSDGYFTLLPGETNAVSIETPWAEGAPAPQDGDLQVELAGWNVGKAAIVPVLMVQ